MLHVKVYYGSHEYSYEVVAMFIAAVKLSILTCVSSRLPLVVPWRTATGENYIKYFPSNVFWLFYDVKNCRIRQKRLNL